MTVLEKFGFCKEGYEVHINFPGGTPVDGPSAGIAMFIAVYSAFFRLPVKGEIAMTGEISLLGLVLPVGGVPQKLGAAIEAGAKQAFIPKENWKDVFAQLPIEVQPLETIDELLFYIFGEEKKISLRKDREVLTAQEITKG